MHFIFPLKCFILHNKWSRRGREGGNCSYEKRGEKKQSSHTLFYFVINRKAYYCRIQSKSSIVNLNFIFRLKTTATELINSNFKIVSLQYIQSLISTVWQFYSVLLTNPMLNCTVNVVFIIKLYIPFVPFSTVI